MIPIIITIAAREQQHRASCVWNVRWAMVRTRTGQKSGVGQAGCGALRGETANGALVKGVETVGGWHGGEHVDVRDRSDILDSFRFLLPVFFFLLFAASINRSLTVPSVRPSGRPSIRRPVGPFPSHRFHNAAARQQRRVVHTLSLFALSLSRPSNTHTHCHARTHGVTHIFLSLSRSRCPWLPLLDLGLPLPPYCHQPDRRPTAQHHRPLLTRAPCNRFRLSSTPFSALLLFYTTISVGSERQTTPHSTALRSVATCS